MSSLAHAEVGEIDLSAVKAAAGVVDVCIASDIVGTNNYGPIIEDDPIFATDLVQYVGQPIFAVAATTVDAARKAARMANIESRTVRLRRRHIGPVAVYSSAVRTSFTLKAISRWRYHRKTDACWSTARRSTRTKFRC
jgi:xanthine dehydrogenase molybdopterin-binding subunit B